MDMLATVLALPATIWVLGGVGPLFLVSLALWHAPAKTNILVDTPTSTARADMGLLWGIGPRVSVRLFSRASTGAPVAPFNDAVRAGHALITPGIADVVVAAICELIALKPRVAEVKLLVDTGDSGKDRVVETAVQAALTLAPSKVRDVCSYARSSGPGAELSARFELNASPSRLSAIWKRLRTSRPAREFVKRLNRKPKPVKKPVREVRTT